MTFLRLLARRLVALLPVLLITSLGVFSLTFAVPGDPARTLAGGENATPEQIARVRDELGLDDPLVEQYGRWVSHAIVLDFGNSLVSHRSVNETLIARMPATLTLAISAMLVALLIGLVVGVSSGIRPGSWSDRGGIVFATLGVSIPSFVLAILLIRFFAIDRGWFPAIGFVSIGDSVVEWLHHIALPALALGWVAAAALGRQLRSGLIESLRSDYVRTSWALGSSSATVVGRHALRNAAIPAITVAGLQLTTLLGGTVVIEKVFSIQGIGSYLFDGVLNKDLPIIQGVVVWFIVIQLAVNLIVDMVLLAVNPRLRVR